MASLLTQFKAAGKIALYLVVAYVAIKLWQDPAGAADSTVNVIGSIGSFFAALIDQIGTFVQSLGD